MGGTGGGESWVLLWWAELNKTVIWLSADEWGWVLSLLVVWPEVTQHWSLPSSLVGLMADSGWAHAKEYFPQLLCQCPCPHSEPQPPHASAGDPPTVAGKSGSASYGVTAPSSWVLMCTLLCVCPPRVESLFPSVLSKSCSQIPLAFKVWFSRNLGILPPIARPPCWEAWRRVQNLHSTGWTSVV